MNKIAVITMTRAEYGLILPVLRELRKNENEDFRAELVVGGTHLNKAYGMTVNEIIADGVRIDQRIDAPVNSDTEQDIANNISRYIESFTALFIRERYTAVLILGDRYEMLAVAIAAGITRTPVFHLCGGDTTEGAIDEWIRHSITKIASIHFVTNEISRKRVIQLGEAPDRVFNYGSTSLDNIMSITIMSKEEALQSIDLGGCEYALCTWQPVTAESADAAEQIEILLKVIKSFPDITFIVTKANADYQGNIINRLFDDAQKTIPNMVLHASLGVKRYISLMRHCSFVLGNSSSGIVEAPACGVPTVNIGDRQKGRLKAQSIVDCDMQYEEICNAIVKVRSDDYRKICFNEANPYGNGDAGEKIAAKCMEIITNGKIELKKSFYDCGV